MLLSISKQIIIIIIIIISLLCPTNKYQHQSIDYLAVANR